MGILLAPLRAVQLARGTLFPWVPMFIGCGVAIWFAWPSEPAPVAYLGLAAAVLVLAVAALRGPDLARPLLVALACIAVGGLAAGFRGHAVQAPALEFRYYGPVQGRIIGIDRSGSDALRLTLDRVVLDRVAPNRTPLRVRVSVAGEPAFQPGQVVLLTAHLSAPEGPVEPGGFDFRRMAYFNQLGAVGYTRTPVMLWAEAEPGTQLINRLRSAMGAGMRAQMPSQAGAFAAGAMTGDRSGITLDTVQALRDSNLAHLLAISGMNLAFLIGFTFALIRYGVALVPVLALRVDARKVAAVLSLGVAWFYLLLSGSNVATERAFIMVAVMLGAVLLDRRALTLRSVAIAGVIILLWQPESLLSPGFQMSFAATVALIAGFGGLDGAVMRERLPRWVLPLFTLVLSSVLAGAATAPFAAAHFNRFTDYGLLANLLTVPVMSLVMAAGAVAALLTPLGLEALPLWVMEQASRWILFIAHWIAGLEGSVTPIKSPGPWVLPLISFGGAWIILWRGRARLAGLVPVAAALVLWSVAHRPLVLIESQAALVGRMGDQGRALSAANGAGFAAENWLADDGDLATQDQAAERAGFTGPKGRRAFDLGGLRAVSLTGKAAEAALPAACAAADLVVIGAWLEAPAPAGCLVIDRASLAQSGSLAVDVIDGGLRITPARRALRLWSGPGAPVPVTLLPRPDALLAAADP